MRFGVYWANLDPTVGREIRKTRPVVVVSPDVMNDRLGTVIVCPLTSTIRDYPTRLRVTIQGKEGSIAADQIRSIDKVRILDFMDQLDSFSSQKLLDILQEMLA